MAIFDSKQWNDAVFQKYMQKIPNVKENSLVKNGILMENGSLKARLVDGVGGNTLSEPIKGLLDGDVINYDGNTDITATSRKTFLQNKIVCGRAKAWSEKDFSTDLTGVNFMDGLSSEIAEYYQAVDQADLLAIIAGIFSMTDTAGAAFVTAHTYDISEDGTAANRVVGASTLNSAIAKSSGDKKGLFNLAFMHSVVATNLENLQLLEYRKYTDANGIQRDIAMADWNGRTVIIDDEMPTAAELGTAGVQTLVIGTAGVATDTITVSGVTYTVVADSATGNQINAGTASAEATSLLALLQARTDLAHYTITRDTATLTFTMKTGYGTVPVIAATVPADDTIKITLATTTPAVYVTQYTSYVLGKGAFEFSNVGAKVPSETYRDPYTDGGIDTLITRQRKLYAPKWISWVGASSIISPTGAELATGSNWEIVNDGDLSSKTYVNNKMIPFVRIISRG